MLFVTPGKRRKANRTEVTKLLLAYRTAKDAEKAARTAAEDARLALIGIAGDAEILVDKNGVTMCKIPERERRTMPVVQALELHPDLESIVNHSHYRVVSR